MASTLRSALMRARLAAHPRLLGPASQPARCLALFGGDKDTPKTQDKAEASKEKAGPSAFQNISGIVKMLKSELIDESKEVSRSAPYQAPMDRRREAVERKVRREHRVVASDDTATGVTVHKDAAWKDHWTNFKENSKLSGALSELRVKYEESENPLVRGFRFLTESATEKATEAIDENDSAHCYAEISRLDPTFNKEVFLHYCERQVFPAVLEALIHNDRATLKDWFTEGGYAAIEQYLDAIASAGLVNDSRILDIRQTEIHAAQLIDEYPTLTMIALVQQTHCVRDKMGAIVEGAEDQIERGMYVLIMRRDPNEFDPLLAWSIAGFQAGERAATW